MTSMLLIAICLLISSGTQAFAPHSRHGAVSKQASIRTYSTASCPHLYNGESRATSKKNGNRMQSLHASLIGHRFVQRIGDGNHRSLSGSVTSLSAVAAVEEGDDIALAGMPDKVAFLKYYSSVVDEKSGLEMTLEQFKGYEVVQTMLSKQLVLEDDLYNLWISAVGDAKGLNGDEGYEMLCMVADLPDPEDETFLDDEFKKLAGKNEKLSFFKFLNWADVKDMMSEEVLSMEEVTAIWRATAKDLDAQIDRVQFGVVNRALDDAIEAKEQEDADVEGEVPGDEGEEEEEEGVELTAEEVWSSGFDAAALFDDESLSEITSFFEDEKGPDGLTFDSLLRWEDIQEMIADGSITSKALESVWREAPKASPPTKKRLLTKSSSSSSSLSSSSESGSIDFDAFKRLNVRIDMVLDEIEEMKRENGVDVSSSSSSKSKPSSTQSSDIEGFYREEFRKLTGDSRGRGSLGLSALLKWQEIVDLVQDGAITEKQVTKMFESMPKESSGDQSEQGITESTFLAFNGMLDVILDGNSSGEKSSAVTPAALVSEKPRPMPSQSELKMGELAALDSKVKTDAGQMDATTGLSETELGMMQVLDAADNMLNSGGFGDFDQLIGDVNDPRLGALRDQPLDSEAVRGDLKEVLEELLQLARGQSRCGMDPAPEEEAARMRDLIRAVTEKATKTYTVDIRELGRKLSAKWRLLYTNSEMFSFYNGITGLVNVYPGSKFKDLSFQYSTDGYLSESQYFEDITTPLGTVTATVFSDWEMVKEMSFMTNENSVVLRSFCKKVTAGPFEYEAQENWKSLRTMAMNELLYVDDRVAIMRNYGALRIYFVLEKIV